MVEVGEGVWKGRESGRAGAWVNEVDLGLVGRGSRWVQVGRVDFLGVGVCWGQSATKGWRCSGKREHF